MWIVRIALRRPYTFIVAALVIVLMSPIVLQRTPTDVFPNIDIPVVSICFELLRIVPATDGRPHRLALLALHDHGGGQHRAHRIADRGGPRDHQSILSAWGGRPRGGHADHGHFPNHDSAVAPGHFPAAHHHLFGVERARPAIGHEGPGAVRAGVVRLRREPGPQSTGDSGRSGNSVAVRRQTAPGFGERRYSGAAGERTVARRTSSTPSPRRTWCCLPARSRWVRPNSTWR